jgi:hypothetical protein
MFNLVVMIVYFGKESSVINSIYSKQLVLLYIVLKKPLEGSSEKVNKIKILKKKIEGISNGVKIFTMIKLQKHFVIVKK